MDTVQASTAAVAIGIAATAAMDVWLLAIARLGVPTTDWRLVGRWVAAMPSGRFAHASIAQAPAARFEHAIGWATHYAVGIAYALLLVAITGAAWLHRPAVLPALAFGLASVVMPLFVMQPAMGAGFAAAKTATPWRNRLRALANHGVFGLGLYMGAAAIAFFSGGAHAPRAIACREPDAQLKGEARRHGRHAGPRNISYGDSRFDRYAQATVEGDAKGQEVFVAQEVRGLRVFLGKGQCVTCHNGPLLTDHAFRNTGVPARDRSRPDRGRADGLRKLLQDEFNCPGRYSDAKTEQCGELQFLATDDAGQLAAFRTPSLRNVAQRAPYMHAGQFATLEQVVQHYASAPKAVQGYSELVQADERHAHRQAIRLADADIQDVAAFLRTLTGPVVQAR